jgi:hypothetical protein
MLSHLALSTLTTLLSKAPPLVFVHIHCFWSKVRSMHMHVAVRARQVLVKGNSNLGVLGLVGHMAVMEVKVHNTITHLFVRLIVIDI